MPICQVAIWELPLFMHLPSGSGKAILKAPLLVWQDRIFDSAQKQLQQLWLW